MAEPPPPARRRSRWLRPLLAVAVVLVGCVVAGNVYLVASTSGAVLPDVAAAPARPYVIVLGNKTVAGVPCRELAARLEVSRALYAAGQVRKIVVSGAVRPHYEEPYTMAAWLERHGVPRQAIVIDPGGHRTAATMANAAALGIHEAVIATQAYHLPRSIYLARHAGIDAVGVPAASNERSFKTVIREWLARAEVLIEVALRGVRS
jgi:vancomycin permeability regulator SanA